MDKFLGITHCKKELEHLHVREIVVIEELGKEVH